MTHFHGVGNARTGIHVRAGSNVTANAVTSNDNRNGALAEQGGLFECIGCTMTGNTFFAARARFAGTVSLGNCVIAGSNGILGEYDGYAEAYCESSPCSLNVSGAAIWGSQRGSAAVFSIGDFAGQIWADANGETQVVGSRQISTAGANEIDSFSTLSVYAGRLSAPLTVSRFGRVTITGSSVVAGRLDCSGAGDVWLGPSVSVNPGASITGCAHAGAP